jgi:hypothetical protein
LRNVAIDLSSNGFHLMLQKCASQLQIQLPHTQCGVQLLYHIKSLGQVGMIGVLGFAMAQHILQ